MTWVSRVGSEFCRMRAFFAPAVAVALAFPLPAQALVWQWNYTSTSVAAAGSFITADAPGTGGFYQITGIAGSRNGIAITSLYPTGSAIPGNEGFPVDNLVNAAGLLTGNGFGFQTADGSYSNPFFASFLTPPGFVEVFTQPATGGYSELPIVFAAVTVPEPGTAALVLVALAGFAALGRRRWSYQAGAAMTLLLASSPVRSFQRSPR